MKLTLAIFAILSAIAAVAAVDIRGYSSHGCWGYYFVCHNIPANACCNFPFKARSMRWTLPTGTRGIGQVRRHCSWNYPMVYGPRYSSCVNYNGLLGVRSGRWQQGICKWTFRRSVLLERQDEVCQIAEGCIDPNVFVYTTETGANRTVTVDPGSIDAVAKMAEAGDMKGLATLPDYKEALDTNPSVDFYDFEEPKEGEVPDE
ncbi:uncharacterized protein H6S33_011457 [Morchella sextelata]|uniref:uncharacterized protein n=1 Tax=Morchella sextelata TaxID=1174677 RepID=UPI001D0371EA|nr:uncharacterized protein H6S33_011457 [Morchella sextelata]KAH0611030.1 hypothetical protein H6S33_011457 [Morchella sextelata]